VHEARTVAPDNTVRYQGRVLQIPPDRYRGHYVKAKVRVHAYPDGTLAVFHGPRCLGRYAACGDPLAPAQETAVHNPPSAAGRAQA
jgi:hypothetical protein